MEVESVFLWDCLALEKLTKSTLGLVRKGEEVTFPNRFPSLSN